MNVQRSIRTLLVANRGEIACAVMEVAKRMGMMTVAVFSDADAKALHVRRADRAVRIGPAPARDSYLNIEAILAAVGETGADAVHPGYGFLSENAGFAEAVLSAGLIWVGPPPAAIRAMGLKDAAKRLMEKAGVPVVPGYHGDAQDIILLAGKANEIGYPVLIKAAAGGGGRGMRLVEKPADFRDALAAAKREAKAAFGDERVLVEKFIVNPRHIEVQVFGDAHGNLVHLYERDCSLQRRHQKVMEEAPAPGMTDEVRAAMTGAALKAARAIGYQGAGTVEFIVDGSGPLRPDGFWFMEMNTRLQVEHRVTQAVTGVDLIEWQLRVARGEALPLQQGGIRLDGHAVQARLYAEDPAQDFLPSSGRLHAFHVVHWDHMLDAGFEKGDEVPPHYDAMLGKLIVHAPDRTAAFATLAERLSETDIAGVRSNAGFLAALAADAEVVAGRVDTGLIARRMPAIAQPPEPNADDLAHAAVAAAGLHRAAGKGFPHEPLADPWDALAHFSLAGPRADIQEFGFGGRLFRARIVSDGDHATVMFDDGASAKVRLAMKRHGPDRACVTPVGVTVFKEGHALEFTVPDPFALAAEREAAAVDALKAPLPGLVKLVRVKVGDPVSKGEPLLVLEAMKMEHTLSAPHDGVIEEIAAEGRQVAGNAIVVRFRTGG
jgi:3-methylcrotonyl-CoA carboxylase alpha subunit